MPPAAPVRLPYECGWGAASSCGRLLVDWRSGVVWRPGFVDARDEQQRVIPAVTTPRTDVVVKAQRRSRTTERPTRDVSKRPLQRVEPRPFDRPILVPSSAIR